MNQAAEQQVGIFGNQKESNWLQFSQFLNFDRNHSQKECAVSAEKSRFLILEKWFSDKDWNTENFRSFLSSYREKGRSQSTENKFISLGRSIDIYLRTDVTKTIKTRKEKIPQIESVLSYSEILQLAKVHIEYSKFSDYVNQRQRALIMLLGTTGCRAGEALDLKWEDVYKHPRKHVIFMDTKNDDDRKVCIGDEVYDMINALSRKSEFVFTSGRGKKLHSSDLNNDLKKRAEKLGIDKRIHAHLFRHSYATTMLESGVGETDVCQIAGWHDQKMLLRYKNSTLDHFHNVIRKHPLLISEVGWSELSQMLIKAAEKILLTTQYDMYMAQRDDALLIFIPRVLVDGPQSAKLVSMRDSLH